MARHAHGGRRRRSVSRHWWLVALAAIALAIAPQFATRAALPSGASGQAAPPTVGASLDITRLLEELGASQTDAESAVGANAVGDGHNDLFAPNGSAITVQNPNIDLGAVLTTDVALGEPALDLIGPCDRLHVICAGGPPHVGEYYAYAVATGGPVIPTDAVYVEIGVAAFDRTPLDGKKPVRWKARSFAPNDFFNGLNTAWSFSFDNVTNPKATTSHGERQFYGKGQAAFVQKKSKAFAVVDGAAAMVFIPETEWDGVTEARVFTYQGTFTTQVADTYPDIMQPALPFDEETIPSLQLGFTATASPTPAPGASESIEPTARPTPEQAATPSATLQPTAATAAPTEVAAVLTPGPPPQATVTPGALDLPSETQSPRFEPLVLIGFLAGGLFLLVAGGWLYFGPGRRATSKTSGVSMSPPASMVVLPDPSAFPLAAFARDPCPDLARHRAIARARCEAARAAAEQAKQRAQAAHADADAAHDAAERAVQERQRMERLVRALEQPPDPGSSSASSGGETVTEYDLQLRAENNAAANAWYESARAAAGGPGGDPATLQGLAEEWGKKLNTPLDSLRAQDAAHRAERLAKARHDLAAAHTTENDAAAEARRADERAYDADTAATEAQGRADGECAAADKADDEYAACVKRRQEEQAAAEKKQQQKQAPPPSGSPPSVTPPLPPPPPSGKPCPPPDDEWRHEGASRRFVVPVKGARITWTSDPPLDGLQGWVHGQPWDGPMPEDADPDSPAPRQDDSVSRDQFKTLTNRVIANQFRELLHPSKVFELTMRVQIPVHTVTVDCERRWACEGGHLVRTSQTRAVLTDGPAPSHDGTWQLHVTGPQPNEVGRFIAQVQRALARLERAEYDLDTARASCGD
jgi:hypothetical protein